nr:hypothetical protein [Tanacetum cinerariifolium]
MVEVCMVVSLLVKNRADESRVTSMILIDLASRLYNRSRIPNDQRLRMYGMDSFSSHWTNIHRGFDIAESMSIDGTTSIEQPHLKDKSMWSDQEKRIQKIDHLARSLLIQGLPNDIYSLIDSNKTAKDLWDALVRHMLGSEYGVQDMKAAVLYEYETFKATEGELLLDTYIRSLQVINDLKKCCYLKDNYELTLILKRTGIDLPRSLPSL